MVDQETPSPPKQRKSHRARYFVLALVVCALAVLFGTVFLPAGSFLAFRQVAQNFKVAGSAMDPTYRNGDFLMISKLARKPARFDVIVLRYPKDETRYFLSRVIGLSGERVEVRNGRVQIDGETIDEPFVKEHPGYSYGPEVIPEDHYFVLGDNRNNSSDSHIWGFLPGKNVIGTVQFRYWPPQHSNVDDPNRSPTPLRQPTPGTN